MKKKRESTRNSFVSNPHSSNNSSSLGIKSSSSVDLNNHLGKFPTPCLQETSSLSLFNNPNTPLHKSVIGRSGETNSLPVLDFETDCLDSGYDSGGDLAVATNQDVIVSVCETFTRNNAYPIILLSISGARTPTNLGKKQGAHVTAYRSLLEVLISCAEGYDIREAKGLISAVAKAIMPDKAEIFDLIIKKLEERESNIVSDKERRSLIAGIKRNIPNLNYSEDYVKKIDSTLAFARRKHHIDSIQSIATIFIQEVNLDDNIAFKRSGLSDSKEGSRVRVAVHALKLLVELTELSANYKLCTEKMLKHLSNNYLIVNAPYKDGLKGLGLETTNFGSKIDSKLLQNLLSGINKNRIAGLFGDLFDFKYEDHVSEDIEILFQVLARHLVIIFTAFDSLRKLPDFNELIDCFLVEEILKKSNWCKSRDFVVGDGKVGGLSGNTRKMRRGRYIFSGELDFGNAVEILRNGISKYADLEKFRIFSTGERLARLGFK